MNAGAKRQVWICQDVKGSMEADGVGKTDSYTMALCHSAQSPAPIRRPVMIDLLSITMQGMG